MNAVFSPIAPIFFADLLIDAADAPPLRETFFDSLDASRVVGLIFAAVVVAFAVWQFRTQLARVRDPRGAFPVESEREFKFLKRQAFRRLQLSGLAGIVGAAMLIGLFVPAVEYPRVWTFAWVFVALFSVWAAALACVDAASIYLREIGSAGDKSAIESVLREYEARRGRRGGRKPSENGPAPNAEERTSSANGRNADVERNEIDESNEK